MTADNPRPGRKIVPHDLMTPAEVAAAFRVDPKTVTRWAKQDKLPSVRTLGGHRRYLRSVVEALLEENSSQGNQADGTR